MTPDADHSTLETFVPKGFKYEKLDTQRKDGLSEWKISLDKEFSHDAETNKFLEKYNNLSFHVWGNIDESNGENIQQAFKKCGVVLASGLASNHKQWDTEDSFVSKLAKDLNDKTPWVGVAVDLPGFGGSKLVPGQESEENVSGEEFTHLIQFMLDKFKVEDSDKQNITLIGHSSGGEAVLPFSTEGYKVFAFNPALKSKLGLIFKAISAGTYVGSRTRNNLPGPTNTVLGGFTKVMAGHTTGIVSKMTQDEQFENWNSFNFKNIELSRVDVIPTKRFVVPPSIFTPKGDRLTPISESHPFLIKWLQATSPEVKLDSLLINIPDALSKSTPHNGMFILPEVSDILASKVSEHIQSILSKQPIPAQVPESVEVLEIVPEVVEAPKPVVTERDIKKFQDEFIRLNQQAYTMETFAYISSELAKYITPDATEILVPQEFIRKALERIYGHPFILERENVDVENVSQFVQDHIVNPVLGFDIFTRYYIDAIPEIKHVTVANSFMYDFLKLAKARNFTRIPTTFGRDGVDDDVRDWFQGVRTHIIDQLIVGGFKSQALEPEALVILDDSPFIREFAAAHEEVQACQDLVSELLANKIAEFAEKYE